MAGASAALLCSKADEEAAAARDAIAAAIATLDKRRLEVSARACGALGGRGA